MSICIIPLIYPAPSTERTDSDVQPVTNNLIQLTSTGG
jgi:hypothetical protein